MGQEILPKHKYEKYVKDKHHVIVSVATKGGENLKAAADNYVVDQSHYTAPNYGYGARKYIKAKDSFDRSKVPASGANPVVKVPAVLVTLPPIFKMLDPPSNVPLVRVQAPEIVCVNPVPKFNVPPAVVLASEAAFIFPVSVATPADLSQLTAPVVVNPAMV